MQAIIRKTILSSVVLLACQQASAAAFQLAEISTAGLGRAYAGEAAIGDNASAVATNPALMTRFKRPEVSFGGIYVNPGVHLSGKFSASYNHPLLGNLPLANNVDAGYPDPIASKILPNAYWVLPLNDAFAVGGGVNVNYGLATEYNANYSAGVFGGKTDLTAINLNLSGAYKLNEQWSFGLGFNAVKAEAKLQRRAGAIADSTFAQMLLPGISRSSLITDLEGDDWGYGWNAGLTYTPTENHRFGLAYHSKVKLAFDGRVKNDVSVLLGYNQTAGYVDLSLPEYWELSGFHQLTSKWAMHYSWKYTRWSRIPAITANSYNAAIGQVFNKNESFHDTSRFALGTTYDFDDKLTLRAGIAYDKSASPDYPSSISIPDTDRIWYTLGLTYKFTPDLSVDLAYAYVHGKTRNFVEQGNEAGIAVRGDFRSKAQVNLYGLNINYRF